MSPGPHHFDFPGFSATLPARKGSSASLCHRPSRLSDVTPPPINRNLKPNRKCEFLTAKFSLRTLIIYKVCIVSCSYKDNDFCWLCLVLFSTAKPTPLDLKNNGIIDELPFKSPVTMSWTRPMWVSYKWFELGYPRQLHTHTHIHTKFEWCRLVLHFVSPHGPVCFASGPPWIPCPPSTVDPFLHKASPAPTLQTVRRIMWLWWVPIAGGKIGRAHCVLCFNDPLVCVLRLLSAPCVSETSPLSPLAEPSVYLPSRKRHQQPGP